MESNREADRVRRVEPGEARAHGSDPSAVRVREPREEGASTALRRSDVARDDGAMVGRRDSARWGPIWAGLITAVATFLLLQLLAIGLGLVGIGPNEGGGGGWAPAVIGLIAFFTGGSVAGMTSAIRGSATGLLNGFLVWALGVLLILLLSALGLGQVFGALGNVVGQLGLLQSGGLNVPNDPNVPNPDLAQIAQAVRNGALGAFFGLALSALASALGGFLGGRSADPIGRPPNARKD